MTPLDPNGIKATGATMSGMGIVERTWDWLAYELMPRIPVWRRMQAAAHARNLAAGKASGR